jgi:hypothetical protein
MTTDEGETKRKVICELQALIHERLFGPGPWLLDDETSWAMTKRLEELGLLKCVGYDQWKITPLGREFNLPLLDVFLGFDTGYGETPLTLHEYGLLTEAEMDEVFDIFAHVPSSNPTGAEPDISISTEAVMRPYARRAFLEYFKLSGAVN